MSLLRLNKEYKDILKTPPEGITAGLRNNNVHEWIATLVGPGGTPYEGGIFKLKVSFPTDYPFKPPKITFTTPIYHCNINSKGDICLDILKDNWSPALTVSKVLLSISSLLNDPNPNDPLEPDIAALYRSNRAKHDQIAREHTNKNAVIK